MGTVGLAGATANAGLMDITEEETQTAGTLNSIETLQTQFKEQEEANAQSVTTMAINDMKIG
jgi:hypothetical protein